MAGRLNGKIAIVTGAARGQGAAEAKLFAEEGAQVVVADVLEEQGRAVATEIGKTAAFFRLDVGDRKSWAEAISVAEERFGTVDILVNNAAINVVKAVADTTAEEFERQIRVNQLGPFYGMQAVFPGMKSKGAGSIINVCSLAGIFGVELQGAYGATKGALRMLTKISAWEWAPLGIRVNAIHPGLIDSPMSHGTADGDWAKLNVEELFRSINPMGRPGRPREAAYLATFLASDESLYLTGCDFVIDGGTSACIRLPMKLS